MRAQDYRMLNHSGDQCLLFLRPMSWGMRGSLTPSSQEQLGQYLPNFMCNTCMGRRQIIIKCRGSRSRAWPWKTYIVKMYFFFKNFLLYCWPIIGQLSMYKLSGKNDQGRVYQIYNFHYPMGFWYANVSPSDKKSM